MPPQFPPAWAAACGQDDYGCWAEFVVRDVRQRMRWMAPGEFWMGSPADQDDWDIRKNETPRHRVQISRGFWLADTACTQALWVALMGDNPSHFQTGGAYPVEQVGTRDIAEFLARLAPAGVDGQADLPTEAEWEYACRAGTETAYYFGDHLAAQWINCAGHFPGGAYRERPIPAKALPANPWGLYQMHGNVWEWCADGQRGYDAAPVVDPRGPDGPEAQRALRGGCWKVDARACRSAARFCSFPGSAGWMTPFGFRLVLRR